jgi:hypothetical protein
MTSRPFASIGTAKSHRRNRIINTSQRAQRIITVAPASLSANAHACEHLRSDILRASKFFPDTHALLTWLLDGVADDALGEQDRVG